MRFAVVHCPNPKCRLKVWVPESKLGTRGHCPKCGHSIQSPAAVPADELAEGPSIFESNEASAQPLIGAIS